MGMDGVLLNRFLEQGSICRDVARMLAFVAVRSNEVGTIRRAVNTDFAFPATTDRTDFLGLGGAESLGFALFANRTGHGHSSTEQDDPADYAEEWRNTKSRHKRFILTAAPLGNFLARRRVQSTIMQGGSTRFRAPEWFILVGGCFFILVLGVSAFWEADIRWLHFFQASMYIATIVLSLRANRWGYFIGVSAAGLWDYANVFVTTFFLNGLQQLSHWAHTGRLERPDLLIAVPAWFSNLFIVVGCLWAYSRLLSKSLGDVGRFLLTFVLTTGFFALDMALFQPRYLELFPRMLHPHLP